MSEWECLSCSEAVTDADGRAGCHGRTDHHPTCDGGGERCLRLCPVQVQCGPVVARRPAPNREDATDDK